MSGPAPDLAVTGYTERRSRLLVRYASGGGDEGGGYGRGDEAGGDEGHAGALDICEAVYERPLAQCRHVRGLVVLNAGRAVPPVAAVDGVSWPAAGAHLLVQGRAASLRLGGDGATARFRVPAGVSTGAGGGHGPAATPGHELSWRITDGTALVDIRPDDTVTVRADPGGATLSWAVLGRGEAHEIDRHHRMVDRTRRGWAQWFARCPQVRPEWQDLVDRAWWQLAANVVRLDSRPGRDLVVPSKFGYVAAWQWDSYFISIGLRHGDPELAADQVRFFLDEQEESGFIPDVVHDTGRVATVADLPRSEQEFSAAELRMPLDSPELSDVPVTKPPLAAWAAALVGQAGGPDLIEERGANLDRLRAWWLARPSPDGLPGFEHSYSSGFDDSPLFDAGAPVFAPDLPSYLVVEADVLAGAARRAGGDVRAAEHSRRADSITATLLAKRWDAGRGAFRVLTPTGVCATRTPMDLLPLLTGRLPDGVREPLLRALGDPALFGARYPVPTVALGDADFDADRMWRGPAWVNVDWLVVQGLRRSGFHAQARDLARRVLEMVRAGGGCHEYFRPDTAARPGRAVPGFGWSAALTVDLAVWLGEPDGGAAW